MYACVKVFLAVVIVVVSSGLVFALPAFDTQFIAAQTHFHPFLPIIMSSIPPKNLHNALQPVFTPDLMKRRNLAGLDNYETFGSA